MNGSIIRRTGRPVTNPQQYVRHLVGHRMQREKQILRLVTSMVRGRSRTLSPTPIRASIRDWSPAAGGSVFAHLLDLERRGLVQRRESDGKPPEQAL